MKRILPGRGEERRWPRREPESAWHPAAWLRVMPLVFAALSTLFLLRAHAQTDTVTVPSDVSANGNLNRAVGAAITAGTLSNTVFALEPNGYYILTGTITVPTGERLTIIAPEPGESQQTAPPQIVFADSVAPGNAKFNFDCFGDIELKNVWLLYANTAGDQVGASLQIEDSPDTAKGQVGVFDGVTFDYSSCPWNASGAVGVTARHFRGTFRNCYFRNCTDIHYRYYGRAVSFPYLSTRWHIDSLLFVNCTFANLGYVIMQEESEYTDFLWMNHCTFVNTVMYCLESTWWYWLSMTNSVFVNSYMYGYIGTGIPEGATFAIDSVSNLRFTPPFTDAQRHILFANSSHCTEPWLADWMTHNPYSDTVTVPGNIPRPQPMLNRRTLMFFDTTDDQGNKSYPYMNRADLYDSTDPGFVLPPTSQLGIKTFLYMRWCTSADTTWAYFPELSLQRIWPPKENLAYTNPILLAAGMGGFPLGDLYHWFPDKYSQWKSQEGTENARISTWLGTGADPGSVVDVKERAGNTTPGSFALGQNFPNPFNPATTIRYELPRASHVTLTLYDLLGREIAALVNGVEQPGYKSVEWNAAGVASGMYLYRLKAGGFAQTRKLLVLR